jgi:Flp pilus assembly protein TadG
MPPAASLRKVFRRRQGAALVETALVLPLCLLFVLGVFEYSRYLMTLHLATNAAREGCRYAVSHVQPVTIDGTTLGNSTTDVTNVVSNYLAGQQLNSQAIDVYQSDSLGNNVGVWTEAAAGQYICVKVTGTFQSAVPNLIYMSSSLPVQAHAVMACEGD